MIIEQSPFAKDSAKGGEGHSSSPQSNSLHVSRGGISMKQVIPGDCYCRDAINGHLFPRPPGSAPRMCAPHTTAPSRDRYTHHMKVSMHSLDPTHPTTVPSSRHASYMYPTPIPSIPRIQSILRIPLILHPSHTHPTPIPHTHPTSISSQPISAHLSPISPPTPQPTAHIAYHGMPQAMGSSMRRVGGYEGNGVHIWRKIGLDGNFAPSNIKKLAGEF